MYVYDQELNEMLDRLEFSRCYVNTMLWLLKTDTTNKQFFNSYRDAMFELQKLTTEVKHEIEKRDVKNAA